MALCKRMAIILFIVVLHVGPLSGAAAQENEAEDRQHAEAPMLHLRGDHDGRGSYRNFTTQAPEAIGADHVEPCKVTQEGHAQWCWQMDRAPVPWTLERGAEAEAVIHLTRLDRVPAGTLDPEDPLRTGKLRLDVVLTHGSQTEVARGTAYVPPPALSGDDSAQVRVRLDVQETTTWNTAPGDAAAVELQIHLSGLVRRDEPPMVTTGAINTDSYLMLPGFPVDAFKQWEDTQQETKRCRELLLAQQPCGPQAATDRTGTPPETQQAAAWNAVLLGPILVAIAALCRSTRRTAQASCSLTR